MPKFDIYITETIEHKITVDAPSLEWLRVHDFIDGEEYPITEELGALIDTRPMDHTPSARHDKLSDHEVLSHQEILDYVVKVEDDRV